MSICFSSWSYDFVLSVCGSILASAIGFGVFLTAIWWIWGFCVNALFSWIK